jgi:integrase
MHNFASQLARLPDNHRRAMRGAAVSLVDEFIDDIESLAKGEDFADTEMAIYLPRQHLPRYTPAFARSFLVSLITVSWKLFSPGKQELASAAKHAGLDVHPHKLRRHFAIEGITNDVPELAIRDMLGHKTLDMTKRYANFTGRDLEKWRKVIDRNER